MTSYPAFCDHILHQNELVAAGICHGDTWNLIFINNMLGEILKLSPGRMDDEPFLPRLTRCGFDEVEESLSEPHGGELIAHHKEGSMYIIRWKSVSIDDSAGGEQVRQVTMTKNPVEQNNRLAELPWQELTLQHEKGNVWRVIASIRDMTELETLQRKLTDLEMETLAYKARLENLETEMDAGFVGHSAPMRRLRKEASKAARTEAITLILGETGTGKTLTAKAIHDMGQRSAEPFIAVNCGAIPMSLMESELFGYEKGAFTGAAKSGKPGMFELAHKGTLLLDEIGELPLPMQAKLLQVLDGHPFHRVGGTKPITVDVRVIAATNKPLADMAASGQFREDLFYRLRVLTVEIPPLRERPDDIPVLAMHFLQEIIKKSGLQKNFDPQVLNCFLTYRWPGNVRELRALVQSLATMSEEETITMQDLPQYMQAQSPLPQGSVSFRQPMREAVAELERNMIMTALTETGSTYKAARRLKVSQSTIVRKAQRYKIGLVEIAHK